MELHCGLDLHSNNTYAGIIDQSGKRVVRSKLKNKPEHIVQFLDQYKEDLARIVVESTYNWYWLVDLLMDEKYKVHLANPSAIQKYSGLKHSDDIDDAFWLAEMWRLGILPEGYIYPKAERPIRDLLRKRSHLVKLRTSLITSLQNIISRNCGIKLSATDIKAIQEDRVAPFLGDQEELALAGAISKDTIDFLGSKIRYIETEVKNRIRLKQPYTLLRSIPGVGNVLALTIMLETGPISRFSKVGDYVSYCRKVPSLWTSNGKKKGKGNSKCGNRYLAWAFSEASELSRRTDANARAYYNRKRQKTNLMVAHAALAHKLARAAYYIMRDQVSYMPEKLFR
ncbi:MAG: IS110 family transposase [Deltaproteobacteria bacterium]|jgi:transposase|nr:IS110 family transposase [Deltaproteobacteria bacterium]